MDATPTFGPRYEGYAGFVTTHVAALEAATGTPVIASDNALQWAMLRVLDLGRAPSGWGHLLSTV